MRKHNIFILCAVLVITAIFASETMMKGKMKAENYKRSEMVTSPQQAKKLLVEGNNRFKNDRALTKNISKERRLSLAKNGQHPFAIVLSCSDSRVPDELVFDQGLGDIFVVRNAGNVVDPIALGSIEYGAYVLKAPLIVVLGHSKCGAVKATVEGGEAIGSIESIVKQIQLSYEQAQKMNTEEKAMYSKTEDLNILNSTMIIKNSPVIKKLMEENKLQVVGAKYDITTGDIVFDKN